MSIKIMSWVWDNSPQDGSALLLLLALADAANDEGYCWPGLVRLAKKIRRDRRHVIRLIEELEKSGAIQVRRRKDGKLNRSNMYRVMTPESLVTPETPPSDIDVTTPSDAHVTTLVTPMSPESSLNRNDEPSIKHKDSNVAAPRKRPSKADPRTDHAAIKAILKVMGRRPPIEQYDYIIARLGETPDTVELWEAYQAWIGCGYNARNLPGILDWYVSGQREPGNRKDAPRGKPSYISDALAILDQIKQEALAEEDQDHGY